jgi:hypothetical protein
MGRTHIDTQEGNPISLLLFFLKIRKVGMTGLKNIVFASSSAAK